MPTTDIGTRSSFPRPPWLPESEWPFSLNALRLEGHSVHYVDEGRGPVLLFVHAGFWSFVWRDVIRTLSNDFRCIALDFPGHGLTEASSGYRVGLETHSSVLRALVRELGIQSATWILHDLGGPIGLAAAAHDPKSIHGIVMSQTFAWPPDDARMQVALRSFGSRPLEFLSTLTNLIPRVSAGPVGVGRRLARAGRAAFLGPFQRRGPRRAFHRLLADASRAHAFLADVERSLLGELSDRRVLTIFGEKNDPFGYQQRLKGMFPDAREHVVQGARHFPMCDDPEVFASRVRVWHAER